MRILATKPNVTALVSEHYLYANYPQYFSSQHNWLSMTTVQFALDTISRITHVSTAIVLVGGSVFTLIVVQPILAKLKDEEERARIHDGFVSRWKRVVHIGILLFLVSGLYNYVRAIGDHKGDGLYHGLMGTKMLLALVVFFLAAALVGRSSALQRFRDKRRYWTTIMVLLATVIVCVSGYVKVRGKPLLSQETEIIVSAVGTED
jgi:uncharacterized membrane protein